MTWRFAVLLLLASSGWSCVCGGVWPTAKQAWRRAELVFLGTVEVAAPDEGDRRMIFQPQFVRIRVDEAFKGASKGQTIELHQDGSDCDAKFTTGERAVFYLDRGSSPGTWSVPQCTRAFGNPEADGDDLLFLRRLPGSAAGTRLSGEVNLYEDSPKQAFRRVGGVPKVRVKISGSGGPTLETATNAAGAYEVFGLKPGQYSVQIDVPDGFKLKFGSLTGSLRVGANDSSLQLLPNGSAGVNFVLQADTRVSGRILDAEGAPLQGVCMELEPVGGRTEDGAYFFNCSKADGRFSMEMMPAGEYWLVARDKVQAGPVEAKSTLYYPGVRDRARAKVVSVETGKYTEGLEIRMPGDERRYKITGRFVFADGAPVGAARVTFASVPQGYSDVTTTGDDGSFTLRVTAGMAGHLSGQLAIFEHLLKSCPEFRVSESRRGMLRFLDATPIVLSADRNHEDLRLELSSPSCKAYPRRGR